MFRCCLTFYVAVSLFGTACSTRAALPPTPLDITAQLGALHGETGVTWQVRIQPQLGTPAFLEGRTGPLAVTPGDAERAARAFVSSHAALFAMSSDDLATESSSTDALGTTHVRFQQRVQQLSVWGSELLVHFDATGALVRINGLYGPIVLPGSLTPKVTADTAVVEAVTLARFMWPNVDPSSFAPDTPALLLYPDDAVEAQPRTTHLAWHFIVKGSQNADAAPVQLETFVDAIDGRVLAQADRVETIAGSGVGVFGDRKALTVGAKQTAYWLEDTTRGGESPSRTFSAGGSVHAPGSELRSSDVDKWDADPDHGVAGAGVDAHAYVAATWDYFLREHGRSGWLDDGAGVRAVVHYGEGYANAFYDGAQLVFGDGDAAMTAPSAALDIVAHELTHGVIDGSAALDHVGVPGAIDEGLADLFACLVSESSGQGATWQIGETVFHPLRHLNVPLRDLANPHATGQPETRGDIDPQLTDPHVSASIVGHLGYILVEGSPFGVRPLGSAFVGKLFYRAMTTYLFQEAGWDELGDAVLASVRDLDDSHEDDVLQALIQMGLK